MTPSNHDAGKCVTIGNLYLVDGNWQADVTMDRGEVMLEAGIKKTTAAQCAEQCCVPHYCHPFISVLKCF